MNAAIIGVHACAGIIYCGMGAVSIAMGIVNYDVSTCSLLISLPLWCIIAGIISLTYFACTVPCYWYLNRNNALKYLMVMVMTIVFSILTILWQLLGISILWSGECPDGALTATAGIQVFTEFTTIVPSIMFIFYIHMQT